MKSQLNRKETISLSPMLGACCLALCATALAQTPDAALNALVKKGFLTDQEAKDAWSESQSNLVAQATTTNADARWKLDKAFKSITLFGDARFRYEYRSADNAPGSGATGDDYRRERFRYALRLGLKGDLFDDFYYGMRLETSANPRSPWVTFGDDTNPTPFAKNSDGINLGQLYLGWRTTDWLELTVGKMPMPLYVTPMIWDADLNPEGFAEKFKHTLGSVDLFANFGQFLYQDSNPDRWIPSSDTFTLAWQLGANVRFSTNTSFKIAPAIYQYLNNNQNNSLGRAFSGQGLNGLNVNTNGYNQNGINDLLVLETPAEFNFKIGRLNARVFGDFAYNFQGADRARAAVGATAPGGNLSGAFTGETKAYQVGFGLGNGGLVYGPTSGLVYGSTSKKHTWEARAYWQHIEQYAADVNLLDSDFFEGRANLEGIYSALAYSITDNVIGTLRYGYAHPINDALGTGGSNLDMPILNPIRNYQLLQVDLTLRF